MKKRITLISTLLLTSTTLAQDIPQEEAQTPPTCAYYNTIQWPTDVQYQTEKTYNATIEWSWWALIASDLRSDQSTFRIMFDSQEVASFDNVSQFVYNFDQVGIYTITHEAAYGDCPISTSTNITTYKNTITYIWPARTETDQTIINNLKQRNMLLHSITDTSNTEKIAEKGDIIQDSSLIIIDTTDPSIPTQKILTTIDAILNTQSPKNIVTISNADTKLAKKIIWSISRDSVHPTYIINDDVFRELSLLRRIGDRETAQSKITSSVQANDQSTWFGFNAFVDTLLFQGIPLPVVANIITLVAITLLLIFTRQVVWLNVFSIYYPILGAITLPLIGKKLFILFFVIALLSHRTTHLLSRKLHILIHAKIGVYLTVYSILTITGLRAMSMSDLALNRDYTQNIGTRATLIGFFVIAIIGQKVFQTKKNIRKHITEIITYGVIIIPLSWMLTSINIQYRMITHTRIVFVAIVLALLLGRFTGMKLLEYRRFGKLLWKQMKNK